MQQCPLPALSGPLACVGESRVVLFLVNLSLDRQLTFKKPTKSRAQRPGKAHGGQQVPAGPAPPPPPGQGHPGRACSHSSSRNGHRESPPFQNNQAFLLSHGQPGCSYFCQTQVPDLFLPSLEASRARALPLFLLATCEWTEIREPLFFWRGTTIFGIISSSLSSPRLAMKVSP